MLTLERIEGNNLNYFLQSGPVAAHILLTSGVSPRVLVAFPAGNSGVVAWFTYTGDNVKWVLKESPKCVVAKDAGGRPLYGVSFSASAQVPSLSVEHALLANIRVIRDAQASGDMPEKVTTAATSLGRGLEWSRDRLDRAAGYRLSIEALQGSVEGQTFKCGPNGWIDLTITALTGEEPLTPLSNKELFNGAQLKDEGLNRTLRFLSYREKFLAGSWRFNTYFGRDTLISIRLLMPVLSPSAIENGLASVLDRLSAEGEVAHEEDIAEFAVLQHARHDHKNSDAPIFNYRQVDGAFLLPPIATEWLLGSSTPRSQAEAFLARRDRRPVGETRSYGEDLVTNLRFVLERLTPFADQPIASNLIGLRDGMDAGNWRDSGDGIGNGRYPYDVNAVLAPASLLAIARLRESGLLVPYFQRGDAEVFAKARDMWKVWVDAAPELFSVSVSAEDARSAVNSYALENGIPATKALASLPPETFRFHAISLDEHGQPVQIIHSDVGFEFLFGTPDPETLESELASVMRPFPAGLITDAGMVVANAAFSPPELRSKFTRNAYHGSVVWSWQQAMMAAGLERQLRRDDLPSTTRESLLNAQATIWQVIEAGREFQNSELWSWSWADGKFHVAAFGADAKDVDESNAAQLWSTVYLAVKRP